jgi:hypothetical protein
VCSLVKQVEINKRINEELRKIANAEKSVPASIKDVVERLEVSSEHGVSQRTKDYFTELLNRLWTTELDAVPDIKSQICKLGGIENYLDSLFKVCCNYIACIIVPSQRRETTKAQFNLTKYVIRNAQLQNRVMENLGLKEKPEPETILKRQIEFLANNGIRDKLVLQEIKEEALKLINDKNIRALFLKSKQDPRYITTAIIHRASLKKYKEKKDRQYRLTQRKLSVLGPTEVATRNNYWKTMNALDDPDLRDLRLL